MRLYLIRHGRQESPLCNVDVPLAREGREQAKLLKERLRTYPVDALYSSHLLRAVETAELLNVWGLERMEREALREIDFGLLTGRSDAQNQKEYADYFSERKLGKTDLRIPGGECGEDVFHRAAPVVEEAVASGKQHVVFVTHGGVIRALVTGLLNRPQAERFLCAEGLEHCSITELWYHEDTGRFTLERLNDYAHLEGHEALLRGAWKK